MIIFFFPISAPTEVGKRCNCASGYQWVEESKACERLEGSSNFLSLSLQLLTKRSEFLFFIPISLDLIATISKHSRVA